MAVAAVPSRANAVRLRVTLKTTRVNGSATISSTATAASFTTALRLEITNPGGIVPPASQHALSSGRPSHAARNPLLVGALAGAGMMRDEGEGITAMFDEMREHGLPRPQIAVEHGIFILTLRNRRNPEKRP